MAGPLARSRSTVRVGGFAGGSAWPGSVAPGPLRRSSPARLGALAEVPEDREPRVQIVLNAPDADTFQADPVVEVVSPFADTHYGTREMIVRDPDGRLWTLQARAGKHG